MIGFELVEQIAKTDPGPIYSLCVQSAMSSASHNDLFGCLHCRLCCLIIMTMMTNDADILIALFHNLLLDLKYKLSVSTSLLWFAGLMTHTQKQISWVLSPFSPFQSVQEAGREKKSWFKQNSLDNDICGRKVLIHCTGD